jgi:hypothetical protein
VDILLGATACWMEVRPVLYGNAQVNPCFIQLYPQPRHQHFYSQRARHHIAGAHFAQLYSFFSQKIIKKKT